jgi:multidrug resistance efflux pump
VVAAIAGYFAYQNHLYVTTDDAQVTGNVVNVYPNATGILKSWDVAMGQNVTAGAVLGVIYMGGGSGRPGGDADVTAPIAGVVVQSSAVVGQQVFAGSAPIAAVVDPGSLWVVAYVTEADVRRVAPGQRVDIRVDALPGATFTGTVQAIDVATQSTFSLIPNINTSGSFTKVSQRIPVNISLDSLQGGLAVGESAVVTIHVN